MRRTLPCTTAMWLIVLPSLVFTPFSLAWSVTHSIPPAANGIQSKGSSRETVLVLGGSGIVGSGIARAFLEAGYHVIVPVRTVESKKQLQEELQDKAEILLGHSVESVDAAMSLRDVISQPVHHVVSSMGSYWSGKMLSQVSAEELDSVFRTRAVPHFNGWKAFYPSLVAPPSRKPNMYVFIQASISEHCYNANASLIHIACAGQVSISKAARAEAEEDFEKGGTVVVGEIRIGHWVVRPENYDEADSHSKNIDIGRCAVRMVQDGLTKVETPFIKLPNRQAVQEYSAGVASTGLGYDTHEMMMQLHEWVQT